MSDGVPRWLARILGWNGGRGLERRRRYCCIDEKWRQFWFRPNAWSGVGMTCQCEWVAGAWMRDACALHGSSGAELYSMLRGRG